jgi:uncharacterized membrane protein YkvA (DUF1232 family)
MWKRLIAGARWLRRDAILLWRAWRHPLAPRWLKPATLGLLFYIVWPWDLIPDVIPVLGQLDDAVLVPLALHFMLSRLPAALRADIERQPV